MGAPERWLGAGVGAPGHWPGVRLCLGWTFQDAGGWPVEVVDEDPAWGRVSPGGQFCEKIGIIVVLSGDMVQPDPLEFVLKLEHLLAVCCHEGAFVGGFLHDLINDQLRIAANVESHSAELNGDAQSIDEGLIFCGIV